MATIGSLNVKLTATHSAFSAGLASASKAAQSFGSGMQSRFSGLAKGVVNFRGSLLGLAGALPVVGGFISALAGGVGLTAWIKESLDGIVATGRFADRLGVTTESLLALRKVAKGVGVDAEEADHALLHLSRELGQAASGSDEAANKFRRLGLDPKKLGAQKMDESLRQIGDRLNQLPAGATRNAAAFQLLGRNGVQMGSALGKGSEAIDQATESLRKNGQLFSRGDAFNAENATRAMSQLENSFKGIGIQLAVQLAPMLEVAAKEFMAFLAGGNSASDAVTKTLHIIVGTFGIIMDVGRVLKLAVMGIELGFLGLGLVIADTIVDLVKLAAKLPDSMGGAKFREAADKMGHNVGGLRNKFNEVRDDIRAIGKQEWNVVAADKWFWEIRAKAARAAEAFNKAMAAQDPRAAAWAAHLMELFDKGHKLAEENITPLEKWQRSMFDLNEMVQAGAISWGTYGRALLKANDELKKSAQIGEIKHPSALMEGSREAASMIIKSRDQANRSDPVAKLNEAIEQQKVIQQQQLDTLRQLYQSANEGKINQVKF